MKTFSLFSTGACHLCEVAQGMISAELAAGCECRVEVVDISESDTLFERYGTRIPVLRHPDGREMDWPFEQGPLARFLRA